VRAPTPPDVSVRPLDPQDIPSCEEILRGLPEWFGIEEALVQYVRDLESLPGSVAEESGDVLGFIALRHHNPLASEIHVLAVRRDHHRSGIGMALVRHAEAELASGNVRLLQVKTLGPSNPDPGYRSTRAAEGNEMQVGVTVTSDKRSILGISATVVHDVVTQNGSVKEDTLDWYSQDVDGNIWYLGEDTKEYENGVVVSTEGSWEAGVDGAQPGILLPADPEVGMTYRQEYYAGQAEDRGKVLSLDGHVEVPYGAFNGCLQTEDSTSLNPDVLEHKYYCRDVGPVLTIDVASGVGREELVTFEQNAQ